MRAHNSYIPNVNKTWNSEPKMKHKVIFTLFIVGFCIIFLGSILITVGQAVQRDAEIKRAYRAATTESTADALDNANMMTLGARILITSGAFTLTLASAIGAWTIEDKYVKLGLLIFSAVITTFLLTPSIFTLTII